MVSDVGDNRPRIMYSWPGNTGRKAHDREAGVALRDWLVRVSTDPLPRVARNFDLAEKIPGSLEVICSEKLRLGLVVNPHHDSLSVAAVGGTHAESDAHSMFSIGSDGTILNPMWIRLFVVARPTIHVVGANGCNVEKLHLDPPSTLLARRRRFTDGS